MLSQERSTMSDTSMTPSAAAVPAAADKTLLLVDDDAPYRQRLAQAMEKRGFRVIQAESVDAAIAAAKAEPPHYAVVDLRLTDGSGLDVVPEIRKAREDCRVVMLTGCGTIAPAVVAIKAGAVDYLPKPADADQVEAALLDRKDA